MRRIYFVVFLVISVFISKAQSVPAPKIETPNVASLEKFGEIPVDLSTGVPNINIPIHTVQYGSINVPISLRYHPGGVRVSQHPGWVGMGWDIQSIGSITRKPNYLPDEYVTDPNSQYSLSNLTLNGIINTYYPMPGTNTSGSALVDVPDWNTKLLSYYTLPNMMDVSADEFSFNFLGYSGKFYFASVSKGWQVASDQNIKVDLLDNNNPRLGTGQVVSAIINEYSDPSVSSHMNTTIACLQQGFATQVFSGFIITVPDGTKYYFGGVAGNAIEFSTAYGFGQLEFFANSWLLTKIIDPDNNEIDFQYSASYPTCDLGFWNSGNSWSCRETTGGLLESNYGDGSYSASIDVTTHGGTLSLPLYLDKITTPNETVTFNRVVSNGFLRTSDNILKYAKELDPNNKFDLKILWDGTAFNGVVTNGADNLQWEQLSSIVVKNFGNQIYRQYLFGYSPDVTKRLTLSSFSEIDNGSPGTPIKKYSFTYNTTAPSVLNTIYDGDYTDHWGYFNNQSIATADPRIIDGYAGSIYNFKQPSASSTINTSGLLTSITYPTGGYSSFTWEQHRYSQVVAPGRVSYTSLTGYTGGSRIYEIKSYLPNGNIALDKKFMYVHGYSNATPSGTESSGILNGTPSYHIRLDNRIGVNHSTIESVDLSALNSLAIYSYNSQGSFIGYDEVAVVNPDGSYTKNYFTSYGTDLNGNSHWDVPPVSSIGWSASDVYYPMSTLDLERGKPIGVFEYTLNDILVKKTILTYRSDPSRMNSYIKLINLSGTFSGCSWVDALTLATENQKFNYNYYVTNKAITTYDQRGKNPITSSTFYQYNKNNLDSVKTEINSKGESIVTTFKYPPDFIDATSVAMTNAHIISPIIETSVSNAGKLISMTHTNYFTPPSTTIYAPQNVQIKIGTNAIDTRQQFYNYDAHGNLRETSKVNDTYSVYLWGYNNQYPVAKIVGATYVQVIGIVSQAQIDAATSVVPFDDVSVRNLLQLLRAGLPNALVTTYTYLPITGVTSETDPRGQTTYYQYDTFQRLKFIKDFNGNIKKTFNYQNQFAF